MLYRLLADAVLLLHVGFVLFVVLGLVLILIGGMAGWSWVRNRWFRWLHLAAIGIVVLQAWIVVVCPLTLLENALRAHAGQASYPGSFIAFWLHGALYFQAPPWVFTVVYTAFGVLVMIAWSFVRPGRNPTSKAFANNHQTGRWPDPGHAAHGFDHPFNTGTSRKRSRAKSRKQRSFAVTRRPC